MHIQKTFIVTLLSLLMGGSALFAMETETAPEQTISPEIKTEAEKTSDDLLLLLIPFVADCDFDGCKELGRKRPSF